MTESDEIVKETDSFGCTESVSDAFLQLLNTARKLRKHNSFFIVLLGWVGRDMERSAGVVVKIKETKLL
ncbi:hypothetical protein GCM10028773_44930 [Spirosoma koreense]